MPNELQLTVLVCSGLIYIFVAFFTVAMAVEKNRNVLAWGLAAFLVAPLAFIVILFAPYVPRRAKAG